jgi:deazaflavin-dependent oxidoreductase (nitroreductase family)
MTDRQQGIIAEFRANGGVVGGMFAGSPLLLLTTTGARTATPRTSPLGYLPDGGRVLVFASNAGLPGNPSWYHNLLADSRVGVEIGTGRGGVESYPARAVLLTGEERDRGYARQAELVPAYAEYQARTSRTIPVIALYHANPPVDPARGRAMAAELVRAHGELRRELAALRRDIAEFVAGGAAAPGVERPPLELGEQLSRHCLIFCGALRTHHTREDGAFPDVEAGSPHLAPVIDRLRREHEMVAQALTDLQKLLAGPAGADELRTELERLASELEEHFDYEERRLLPALITTSR